MRKLRRLALLLIAVSWLSLDPARAPAQLALVEEVFPGFGSAPAAQFVELQAYQAGQNNVMGQSIQIFDRTGEVPSTVRFLQQSLQRGRPGDLPVRNR